VPGNAESGDHFGAAVGFFGEHLAAGAPDEDVGASSNAGMVQLFSWSSTAPVPTGEVKQYTPSVPGSVETGDRFGAAVVFGQSIGCTDASIQIVAGVPGEDIGSRVDAGTVAFLTPPPFAPCAGSVDQANLLPPTAEAAIVLGARWHWDDTAVTPMPPAIGRSLVCPVRTTPPASFNRPRSAASQTRPPSLSLAASARRSAAAVATLQAETMGR
jgi:hypothetical protein